MPTACIDAAFIFSTNFNKISSHNFAILVLQNADLFRYTLAASFLSKGKDWQHFVVDLIIAVIHIE